MPGDGGWCSGSRFLGTLATLPIGMVIGSLVPGIQKVGTWGMLPFIVLVAISGIFTPVQSLWGWVQPIAQIFPVYWLGLGMRAAFLPEAAAALEIGGSWRTLETALVLAPGRSPAWWSPRSSSAGWPAVSRGPRSKRPGSKPCSGSDDGHRSQPDCHAPCRAGNLPESLADAVGVHYQTIGYLERGEYSPSLFLALKIAEYFEVPLEFVFSTEPFARLGSRAISG